MAIAVEVFDSRCNQLGEGPTATGKNNNQVQWCDIYGKAVRSKDLLTGQSSEYLADEHIGFQIPRSVGGDILGTANGPVLRDADGVIRKLPTRADVDGNNYAGVMMPKFHQMEISFLAQWHMKIKVIRERFIV